MGKRYNRKNRKYKKKRFPIYRRLNAPLAQKLITKLKYSSYATLASASGIVAGQVLRGNSVFDPDYSGAGGQPRGFDQLMPLYDHYVVLSSKVTVQITNTGSQPITCFLALRDAPLVATILRGYTEFSSCQHRTVGHTGNNTITLTQKGSVRKFLGRSHPLSDPELKGTVTTNPQEEMYWHYGMAPTDGVSSVGANTFFLIEYIVAFIEPKNVGAS